jgi:predicted DNA-binding protein (UPF0251 family)
MTCSSCWRWRIKLGLPMIGKGNRPTFSLSEAEALRAEGLSCAAIGAKLGVSETAIWRALQGMRISDRGQG